jgi:hypothetical protein
LIALHKESNRAVDYRNVMIPSDVHAIQPDGFCLAAKADLVSILVVGVLAV